MPFEVGTQIVTLPATYKWLGNRALPPQSR